MAAFLVSVEPAKFYLGCAVFGATLFVLRTVLMLAGADSADADGADLDFDVDADADLDLDDAEGDIDAGLRLLTLQGLTAFVMMFGLTGYGITKGSAVGAVLTLAASLVVGVFTLWLVAKAFAVMKGLQSSGTTSLQAAAGEEGVVYLRIPAGGTGKVQVKVGQHLRVVDATSEDKEDICTGERVVVEYTLDGRTLVVRRA